MSGRVSGRRRVLVGRRMKREATAAEVAAALGVTARTVGRWREAGCPARGRGRAARFNVAEVRAWQSKAGRPGVRGGPSDEHGPAAAPTAATPGVGARQDLLEARARKAAAEATRAELELVQVQGELVPLDEVRAFWCGQVEVVKSSFRTLPGRLAPRLVEQPYEVIHAELERELDRTLEAFAAGEPPGPVGEEA